MVDHALVRESQEVLTLGLQRDISTDTGTDIGTDTDTGARVRRNK